MTLTEHPLRIQSDLKAAESQLFEYESALHRERAYLNLREAHTQQLVSLHERGELELEAAEEEQERLRRELDEVEAAVEEVVRKMGSGRNKEVVKLIFGE